MGMTKLEITDAIAKALEKVPIPMVGAAATAVDAVLSVIEADRNMSLAMERSFVQQIAAAKEPWQHIHDIATGNVASASDLGVHTGSNGE